MRTQGVAQILAMGMIEWGQKSKLKKTPGPKISPPKIPCRIFKIKNFQKAKQIWLYFIGRTMRPGYVCTTMNLQIVLNTPKNPYLNQATPKNTCQIILF